MGGVSAGAHLLAAQIRRGSRRLERARVDAVDKGVGLAVQQERARQLRFLHDSALQTLEAVASGRYRDATSLQSRAREEADRLQHELTGRSAGVGSIRTEVEQVVRTHVRRGLEVDLQVDDVPDPPAPVVIALRDACNEALTNVVKHAGVSRATVHVEAAQRGVRVTVQDAGTGFDPTVNAGFGTTESIALRLADVGGRSEWFSEPLVGTRVVLWGPA